MKQYHRLIPLLILLACLGIVGGTSVFAHGSHHARTHHPKKPIANTTVVPDVPPPACFPTPGNVQASSLVKCVGFAFFTPPFALTVTPDCAALTVTDSTGAVIQRTSGGSWVLPFPSTGNLSFSLDGSGCPHGTYQVSVNGPGGGHLASFTASW